MTDPTYLSRARHCRGNPLEGLGLQQRCSQRHGRRMVHDGLVASRVGLPWLENLGSVNVPVQTQVIPDGTVDGGNLAPPSTAFTMLSLGFRAWGE